MPLCFVCLYNVQCTKCTQIFCVVKFGNNLKEKEWLLQVTTEISLDTRNLFVDFKLKNKRKCYNFKHFDIFKAFD